MQDCKVNWRFVFYLLSVNILFSIPESDRKLADMSTDTVAGRNVDTLAFFSGSIFGWEMNEFSSCLSNSRHVTQRYRVVLWGR